MSEGGGVLEEPLPRRIGGLIGRVLSEIGRAHYPITQLQIKIGPDSPPLTDFFRLGQVLAFLEALKKAYGIHTHFDITGRRVENLRQLGLYRYFDHHDISYPAQGYEIARPQQLPLLDISPDSPNTFAPKNYWHSVLPITPIVHPQPRTEADASDYVHSQLRRLADTIAVGLEHAGVHTASLNAELRRILFVVLQELITNAVLHSNTDQLWVALALERTADPNRQPPSATRLTFAQDTYNVLVMDHGAGLLATALNTLQRPVDLSNYLSLTSSRSSHRYLRAQEESLLSTVFRGNLVIRKGRHSEGLYELGNVVTWFDGRLDLFSGRTEINIDLAQSEEPTPRPRRWSRRSFYLPGTIASLILPSRGLKAQLMATVAASLGAKPEPSPYTWTLRSLPLVPRGFFGGLTSGNARRRAEMDAQEIITTDQKYRSRTSDDKTLWHIDLKLSNNLDIIYFDSLLQELCKYNRVRKDRGVLPRLIFSNVPRHLIHRLKRRNCNSFLLLCQLYCLLLDEADTIHILGAPQMDDSLLNVEEMLYVAMARGTVSGAQLVSAGFTPELVQMAQDYIVGHDADSPFLVGVGADGSTVIHSAPLHSLLRRGRSAHLGRLDRVITPKDGDQPVRLLNEATVSFIHNFAQFWSHGSTLLDCAKLLYLQETFPLTDTIVCFASNGHRLASIIQRIAETPRLLVLDPTVQNWDEAKVIKECVIVLDALYPGDESGYVGRLMRQLFIQEDTRMVELRVLCDFRDAEGKTFSVDDISRPVVSVPLPHDIKKPIRLPTPLAAVFVQSQTQLDHAVSIEYPEADEADGELWNPTRFAPTELSTEYWENVSSLRLFSSEKALNDHHSLVFYDDTQRLFKHPRLRTLVLEYLAKFLRDIMRFKIDIVLHPSHPVGSYLAQMVKTLCNHVPLVLSLPQRQYGGRIEVAPHQYDAYHRAIDGLRSVSKSTSGRRGNIRALILDDSVVSGSSLFTMVGLAKALGLEIQGIFVLVNRLTNEVSLAVRQLGAPFEYLYRVHMPIETSLDLSDEVLEGISKSVADGSVSSLAGWAAGRLLSLVDAVRQETRQSTLDPAAFADVLNQIGDAWLDEPNGRTRHVISNLLLHHDLRVIDLETRAAITYNFLSVLITSSGFWTMLARLYMDKLPRSRQNESLALLKRILLLIVQSRFSDDPSVTRDLEGVCFGLVIRILASGEASEYGDVAVVALVCLGLRGSHTLIGLLASVIRRDFPIIPSVEGHPGSGHLDGTQTYRSRIAISAFLGWAVALSCKKIGRQEFDQALASGVGANLGEIHPIEEYLCTLDILADVLVTTNRLRTALKVAERPFQEDAVKAFENAGKDLGPFGYSLVLRMVRIICQAQTVLLFSRNDTDKSFIFTSGEVEGHRLRRLLHSDEIPSAFAERMNGGLLYFCPGGQATQLINRYSGKRHRWVLGIPISTKHTEFRYYVVLGFSVKGISELPVAYYYWIRCKQAMRLHLELAYKYFVEAAGSWSTVTQALRSVHAPSDRFSSVPTIRARREVLLDALAKQDMTGVLERAVRSGAEPLYSWDGVCNTIRGVFDSLCKHIVEHRDSGTVFFSGSKSRWPISLDFARPLGVLSDRYISIRMSVLEFILIESAVNALKYYDLSIVITAEMIASEACVRVTILNDVFVGISPPSGEEEEHGVAACKATAAAVGGRFQSWRAESGAWTTVIEIPFLFVPEALEKYVAQ